MKLIRSSIDLESRVQLMGVLNVTPDSFSDGGRYETRELAVARALEIESQGADLLDIGGESTRPGAKPVSVEEELLRTLPVIEALQGRLGIPISIDTTKYEVAAAALQAGAEIINDIGGLRFDPRLADLAAATGAALVLMHSRGTPETMQKIAPADDLFTDVIDDLQTAVTEAERRGVSKEKLILDPGLGFGKTPEQNLQLINGLDRLVNAFGLPILLGPSRKSFLKQVLDEELGTAAKNDPQTRVWGTSASVIIGVVRGARIVRVHDVGEMAAATRVAERILSAI
jgi:dihydropteroate synthase